MRILILGGTQFIGRHLAEPLRHAGHSVSVLNRGRSADELPPDVERLRGDRDAGPDGLLALHGRTWDVCLDVCGYTPRQVRPSAELLRESVQRYVFISAVRAYGDPRQRPIRESQPLTAPAAEDVTEINNETYGPLKVACENTLQEIYGDRCTILRPQIVVGPHDPTGRYTYWAQRSLQGGETLAPGDGSDHLQVVDVRDLAEFGKSVIEHDIGGAFHVVGPRLTWAEFIALLGIREPVWVSAEILRDAGVTEAELPLYRSEQGPWSSLMDLCPDRALAAGLTLRDPAVTLRDVRNWLQGRAFTPTLSPVREAELIRQSRAAGPQH